MEEFLEGTRVNTEDLVHRVYALAPMPWQRLKDLREHYTLQDRTKSAKILKTSVFQTHTVYGDGYDEAQKAHWWKRGPRIVKPVDDNV